MDSVDPLGMIVIGSLLVLYSVAMAFKGFHFLAKSKATTGIIFRLNMSSVGPEDIRRYAPVVRYKVGNKELIHESPEYSSKYEHSIGSLIPVHYLPDHPLYAYVGKIYGLFTIEIVTLSIGLPVLLYGVNQYFK